MTYEEERKLFSIFTSKKKKKEILARLFNITNDFRIEYMLTGDKSSKAFKVFYKLSHESLVDFYKRKISWNQDFLNTIPLNIATSDFFREIINLNYTFELYRILCDEKVAEGVKEVIYNTFEKEIEWDIEISPPNWLTGYLSRKGLYSKLEDKIIETISEKGYLTVFRDIFSDSEISEEIKKKIFDMSKETLKQSVQREKLSSLLYYLEAKETLYGRFADLIIDSLKDKGIDEYNIHYLIQFFVKEQVPEEIKKRVLSLVNQEQLKEQIKKKDNYGLISLLNDSHCFKEFLDLIIDTLSKKMSIGEIFQLFSPSNRIPNETKDIIFEKIKSDLEYDIALLNVNEIDMLSRDIENTYTKFKELVNLILGKRNLDLERKFLSMYYSSDTEQIFEDNQVNFEQMLLNFTDEQFTTLVINGFLGNGLYGKAVDLIVKILSQRQISSDVLFSLLMKPHLSNEIKEKVYNATETRILEIISSNNLYDFIVGEDFNNCGKTMYPKVLSKIVELLSNTFPKYDSNQQDIIVSRINTLSLDDKSIFFKTVFNISKDRIEYFSNLLSFYKGSPTKFLDNFEKFKYFLDLANIRPVRKLKISNFKIVYTTDKCHV